MEHSELEYVGFWARVGASMIDTLLLGAICWPLGTWAFGANYWTEPRFLGGPADLLINWLFPAVAIILFWLYRQATPGKMAISACIVDARTGKPPSSAQLIGRYFGYYVSALPIGIGLFWVAFDDRKQGWHDKLAGTVVVRNKNRSQVIFDA